MEALRQWMTTRVGRYFSGGAWRSHGGARWAFYLFFSALLFTLLYGHIGSGWYGVRPGMVSPTTFVATKTVNDIQATEKAKDHVESLVEPQYAKDSAKTLAQTQRVDQLFVALGKQLGMEGTTDSERLVAVQNELESFAKDNLVAGDVATLSVPELARLTMQLPLDKLDEVRSRTGDLLKVVLQDGVRPTEVRSRAEDIPAFVARQAPNASKNLRLFITEIIRRSLVPNEFFDEQQTTQKRTQARDSVSAIPILRGQVIVHDGEVITMEQFERLEQLGLLEPRNWEGMLRILGLMVFIALCAAMLAAYIRHFVRDVYEDNRKLLLLLSILAMTLGLIKILALASRSLAPTTQYGSLLGFASPVALAAILVTLLLGVRLSLVSSVLLAVFASILFNSGFHFPFDFCFGFAALFQGGVAAYALAGAKQRSAILKAGAVTALASWFPILAVRLMAVPFDTSVFGDMGLALGLGALGGLGSAVLALGFLPGLEMLFGALSPMRLAELCNPHQPLLRRLLLQTPGTYYHSLMVANLAEAAAEAVGADGLLTRVGAYYHDIGKTRRSRFFVENQPAGGPNPHDGISPYLSRSIIHAHVREGVAILEQHDIPEAVRDIAAQHHGTTLLKFFYYKALQQTGSQGSVSEAGFRYPGPKARTKEAAIVGIADCVEAATRSLTQVTPDRIEALVRQIVHSRLEDGQLDECDLTLRDLDCVVQSMCASLRGIFHTRIAYPTQPLLAKEGR